MRTSERTSLDGASVLEAMIFERMEARFDNRPSCQKLRAISNVIYLFITFTFTIKSQLSLRDFIREDRLALYKCVSINLCCTQTCLEGARFACARRLSERRPLLAR